MAVTQEEYEELVMSLIVAGGNARSLAMEAMQAGKACDFKKASELMTECGKALAEAHSTQTNLIQAEIRGEHVAVMLLMVHAQDHLMDAMVVRDLAQEIIELYKKINEEDVK